MALLTALFSGLLFGVGLMVSGMANPTKVLGFLDIAGRWDPSLAFVMGGAIAVGSVAFLLAKRRKKSLLGWSIQIPAGKQVTLRLVMGSAVFGVGWGLAGFCPGPALVAMGAGFPKAWGFVGAMLGGMVVFEIIERAKLTRQQA
ncbi:YeeE/YedE family protein [Caballeronia sp. Lep1P3]|uniref:YeeE/YedE family protein n=1 Tax=Caballeronia sp. Lep1P3 TaxID=2878150 RepID=UPI001FD0898C|nr:YeeE/YedE family protein [Caballeronia sp. Lep1P3]